MNKYLVIVIGKEFVHPMFIMGDWEKLSDMLAKESLVNSYVYLLYQYNHQRDVYYPYMRLEKGSYYGFDGYRVRGVIFDA